MRSEIRPLHSTHLPIWISIGAFSGKQIVLLNSKALSSLQPRMAARWQRSGGLTLVIQPLPPGADKECDVAAHVEKRKTNRRGLITLTFCFCLSRGSGWIYTILERPHRPSPTLPPPQFRQPSCARFTSVSSFPKGICNLCQVYRSMVVLHVGPSHWLWFLWRPKFQELPSTSREVPPGKSRFIETPSRKHASGLVPFPHIVLSHTWREL